MYVDVATERQFPASLSQFRSSAVENRRRGEGDGTEVRVGQVGNETIDLARLPRRMLTIFWVMSELRK